MRVVTARIRNVWMVAARRLGGALVALVLGWAVMAGSARADGQVALVIGNAAYRELVALPNPANDAQGIAGALQNLGFEVTIVKDAPRDRLAPVIDAFVARAQTADTVLFYYSGHAFQFEGQNRLVPTDAALKSREALAEETWSFAEDVVAKLAGTGRQTLFFLDACRNNPLPLMLREESSGAGLAKPDTGTGSFVAFATQPGAVARDGTGDFSPFTGAMLKHLPTPGISISDLMIRVRNDVVAATRETQVPWDQSSLRAQFYFVPVEENRSIITEADLDAIGGMDEASIRNVIGALAESGVTLEILEVDDAPAEAVDAMPVERVAIDDVDGDAAEAEEEQVALLDETRSVGGERAEAEAGDGAEPSLAERVVAAESLVEAARARAATGPDVEALAAVDLPPDLPRGVQSELRRVGCHRAAIDGQWGPVSRVSLLRYYTAKGSVSDAEAEAKPTEEAYRRLAVEPGVVCEGVEIAPTRVAAARGSGKTRVIRKAPAPETRPKPTAAPRKPRIDTTPTTNERGRKVPPKIRRLGRGVIGG